MKTSLTSIFVAFFAALLVASASVPSDAVAGGAYDGDWSVVINTLRGDCDKSLRYSVHIVNGHVQAGEPSYQAAGKVGQDGEIRVVVAEGGKTANGSGRLVGNNGRGQWRTSTGECAGSWTAVRHATSS
jgi:hypothetical protein